MADLSEATRERSEVRRIAGALERTSDAKHDNRAVGLARLRPILHASDHLQALIVAALSTGCRLGELLSLHWS
jgi:integrase